MRFAVLGPVAVADEDVEVALGGPRQRAVLALLLARAQHAVTADHLVEAVWGGRAGPDRHASLHTYVSNLRRLIGADRLVRGTDGYRLVLRPDDALDATAFEHLLAEADATGAPGERAEVLGRALGLWRGPAYDGLDEVEALDPERARLAELRATAEGDRVEALLDAGRSPVAEAVALRDAHRLDERAWSLLARARYRAGRQAEALDAVRELGRVLADELGLDPSPAVVALEEQILLHDPALGPRHVTTVGAPGYLTSFVGRTDELRRVEAALVRHRLVTVTGPGGAGKTRLVAESARRRAAGTTWFVDLARVAEASGLSGAVAGAVRAAGAADPVAALVTALAGQGGLLVLDNAEHLAEAVARLVAELLAGAEDLSVLVTSRVALGLPGEQLVVLGGMSLGPDGDAERLFADRCAERGVEVAADSADVHGVCRRLDGIPLALELAAAHIAVHSPAELLELLDRRFALLVDHRQDRAVHRSLEATVGWSYGLLDEHDRVAFTDLGVFEGPFTALSAAAVTGLPAGAPGALDRLVAASLVSVVRPREGGTLFRLLETLRAYARDRLLESERWSQVVDRHDTHLLQEAIASGDALLGRRRVATCDRVGLELAEYEVALDRIGRLDPVRALPLGWLLGNVWLFGGRLAEAEARLGRLVEATEGVPSPARADLLMISSWVAVFRNQVDLARRWAAEGLAIYREHDDPVRLAYGLARAGHWAFADGDPTSIALLTECLEVCERADIPDAEAWPRVLLAQARLWSGDGSAEVRAGLLDARERFLDLGETYGVIHADMLLTSFPELPLAQRLRLSTEMVELSAAPGGDNLMRPIALHNLAYAVAESGEPERAAGLNRASVRSAMASGTLMDLGLALFQSARLESAAGRHDRAVTLLAAGEAHFGMQIAPFQRAMLDPIRPAAQEVLGAGQVAELTRIGAAMSAEQAARYATRA